MSTSSYVGYVIIIYALLLYLLLQRHELRNENVNINCIMKNMQLLCLFNVFEPKHDFIMSIKNNYGDDYTTTS